MKILPTKAVAIQGMWTHLSTGLAISWQAKLPLTLMLELARESDDQDLYLKGERNEL